MINELKAFNNPHNAVKMVMNSACFLFGEKEDWETSKKLLGDMKFLERLEKFDLDTVADAKWKKYRTVYLSNADYNEETIESKSKAALAIFTWAVNLEKYYQARKIVIPK
jgi:dynein heavy chain, axonemal